MLKLSLTSKLHCPAFGLSSWVTCPIKGEICKAGGCYAHSGMARMTNVAKVLEENRLHILYSPMSLVRDFLAIIPENTEYFRWFWSGDCFSFNLFRDIVAVAVARPRTKFWMATRTEYHSDFQLPDNLVVRRSSLRLDDDRIHSGETTVLTPGTLCPSHVWECPGECGVNGCRVCWDFPEVPIAYRFHGSAVAKLRLNKYLREKKG